MKTFGKRFLSLISIIVLLATLVPTTALVINASEQWIISEAEHHSRRISEKGLSANVVIVDNNEAKHESNLNPSFSGGNAVELSGNSSGIAIPMAIGEGNVEFDVYIGYDYGNLQTQKKDGLYKNGLWVSVFVPLNSNSELSDWADVGWQTDSIERATTSTFDNSLFKFVVYQHLDKVPSGGEKSVTVPTNVGSGNYYVSVATDSETLEYGGNDAVGYFDYIKYDMNMAKGNWEYIVSGEIPSGGKWTDVNVDVDLTDYVSAKLVVDANLDGYTWLNAFIDDIALFPEGDMGPKEVSLDEYCGQKFTLYLGANGTRNYRVLGIKKLSNVKQQLGDINLGPYALKGATINVLGYEIPLINIEANLNLSIGNLKVITDGSDGTVKVLLGFDQSASANVNGANNSTSYWSESYKEVKAMYQDLTGKKVDTTRLWNKYSALRGKLKQFNANMVVNVSCDLAGYAEFKIENNGLVFSEGGLMASFDADSSLRSYYGPVYVALGIGVGAEGELVFKNENNKVNPHITVSPSFTLSVGAGIGTRSTYAEIGAYGSLLADITTTSETPFRAGIDLGVKWEGYIIGKEIFSDSTSFASVELYPNFGSPYSRSALTLLSVEDDVSDVNTYRNMLNSAETINRDYLLANTRSRSISAFSLTDSTNMFEKSNAYPLNEPNLVSFDDDTMLLVWIDDNGEKTDENMCSLMYSYYNGESWTAPTTIYEDGTNNDMPYVYSDGTYAYIVWQKASKIFESDIETTEMMESFDLYGIVFDSETTTFSDVVTISSAENSIFEFNPVVYGSNDCLEVAWIENSDNNVYQMSGNNVIKYIKLFADGSVLEDITVLNTSNMITDLEVINGRVYYCELTDDINSLYVYDNAETVLIKEGIVDIEVSNDLLFFLDDEGLKSLDGMDTVSYDGLYNLDNFKICYNNGCYKLFTTVLNEDFTKTLYVSTLNENDNGWTPLEVFSDANNYLRNYSPVVLSDNTAYVAYNSISPSSDEENEIAMLSVNGSIDTIDIAVDYVDFDETQLNLDNIDIIIHMLNNSSVPVDYVDIQVLDKNNYVIYEETKECTLKAFDSGEIKINYQIPSDYNNEMLTFTVKPTNYDDYNQENNSNKTTFECIHTASDNWMMEKEPTKTENGYMTKCCTKCGETLEEKELPFVKFTGASLTLHDNIAVNYKADASLFEESGYENPYVKFELNGKEIIVDEYTEVNGKYVFDFTDIAPNQMKDTIYATLYATYDGVVYQSETKEYSVSTYCYNMLGKYSSDDYAEFRTLLVDLLNYGAASQIYTDHNTDDLVNADLTEEQAAWGTSETPELETVMDKAYETISNPTVTWKGAGLNLEDSVTMRFKIATESIEDLKVKVTNDAGEEWIIYSDTFEATTGGYYVFFDGLNAGQMSEAVYVTVYEGNTKVSDTIRYSIESYAYTKQNSGDEKLDNLLIAMMKYGNAANSYIN